MKLNTIIIVFIRTIMYSRYASSNMYNRYSNDNENTLFSVLKTFVNYITSIPIDKAYFPIKQFTPT